MDFQYLGHSGFKMTLGNSVVLIDPFLTGNSVFEASGLSVEDVSRGVTHILLTHGHEDHVGDTVEIAKATGATVVCMVELGYLLKQQGVENLVMRNLGGDYTHNDFKCWFVRADHSSSFKGQYAGAAAGIVLQGVDMPTVYHMGDTDIFRDMKLIRDRFAPEIGFVPMGGTFTMDAKTAARACKDYFQFGTIVPIHYKTFPELAQSAETFADMLPGKVQIMEAGDVWPVPAGAHLREVV